MPKRLLFRLPFIVFCSKNIWKSRMEEILTRYNILRAKTKMKHRVTMTMPDRGKSWKNISSWDLKRKSTCAKKQIERQPERTASNGKEGKGERKLTFHQRNGERRGLRRSPNFGKTMDYPRNGSSGMSYLHVSK